MWLGWQVYIVDERTELRLLIEKRGGGWMGIVEDDPFEINNRFGGDTQPPAPGPPSLVRRWLGDENVEIITYSHGSFTAGELNRIEHAFPEAIIRPAD